VNSTTHNPTVHRSGSYLISADDICLSFPDSTEALRGITLQIASHEFVALVGPSGCGKSTLLRVLSGLQQPTSGTLTSTTSDIGFVFQDPTLLPWRSTLKNIETLLELQGVDSFDRKTKAQLALELVGLQDSAHKYPRQLSGGMKMRASLARTLVTDPSLLLLDEPFAAVDEFTRESLNDDLLAMFASAKFSAVFVTHSITEAVYLSQRVIIMSPRPGSIAHEIQIPFEYPRTPALRYSAEFATCCGEIAALMREMHTI
jgi:NitT/TauT family transport system ATP-binding protein